MKSEVKKGVVFEDGKVIFNEWPVPPHKHIVSEINTQFISQFSSPFSGTPHYPVFINSGTTGTYLLFKNESDILDIPILGPGRNQQSDAPWRPSQRPQPPLANALAPLIPRQINGDP
jgi:hypothetical protein